MDMRDIETTLGSLLLFKERIDRAWPKMAAMLAAYEAAQAGGEAEAAAEAQPGAADAASEDDPGAMRLGAARVPPPLNP